MKIIISGATGFVGRNLVPALLQNQHEVTVIGRDSKKAKRVFQKDVTCLSWEQLDSISPNTYHAVINLAGENIAERRWSDATKKSIKDSRVNTTKKLVKWLQKTDTNKPHLYNASAIGIYGLQDSGESLPPKLSESVPIDFEKPKDFLSEIGVEWESATNEIAAAGLPVTLMRFAVVLKRGEGMLKKLELPFSLGLGSILGNGHQAVTWIDIDDLVNAILFLLKHPDITGPVNLCAPQAVSQKSFAKSLANTLHRPVFLRMPSAIVNLLFGQMGKELLLGGQNIYPERLLKLGFQFLYPDLDSALQHEWKR